MESGSAPPPSYQAAPEIPTEIFQPLLSIAQRGYDANDIKSWYLTMLRHLRRMGEANAEAAYTLVTPVSDKKAPLFEDDSSSSVNQMVESDEDHISPRTVPTGWSWSRSASYEPSVQENNDRPVISASQQIYSPPTQQPQQVQLQIPSSTQPQQIYYPSSSQPQIAPVMSANYSPTQSREELDQLDVNEICTAHNQPVVFAGQSRAPNQWFSPDDLNGGNVAPQAQFGKPWLPAQPPYQVAMSNTAMPLLVPFNGPPHPPPQPQPCYTEDLIAPFSHGFGLSQLATELIGSPYYPTIDIIPSRKRRKVLKSGVKSVFQSLQNNRQSV